MALKSITILCRFLIRSLQLLLLYYAPKIPRADSSPFLKSMLLSIRAYSFRALLETNHFWKTFLIITITRFYQLLNITDSLLKKFKF